MAARLKFTVGASLVHRQNDGLTAEVVEMKLFNGIEHYRISVRPVHVHTASIWLSGFGLDREFARLHPVRSSREGVLLRAMDRLIRGETPARQRAA
jgi:hypothetical protein